MGDVREAIYFAGHSFESVMNVLTKLENANGDRLIKELVAQGYFDDLPQTVRAGFMDQVLRALPFLRNKLGGHGQGKDVIAIPAAYGDLAIQIAAAFHNFLITKHLERTPPSEPVPASRRRFLPMTTFRSDSSPSALPDKRMMIVREVGEDGRAGRELRFTDLEFDPLDYEHLVNRKLDQPMIIPLAGRGTIVGGDVADTEIGRTGRFRTELQSRFASKSIGLVKGGWLPSALAIQDNSVVLPDRCVIAELDRRLKDSTTKYTGRIDFIDLFADHAIRINPALFALEADEREHSTAESAKRSLDEAVRKLRSALPNAILVADDANGLKGVLGLIEDTRSGMDRKQDFLIRLNPRLQSPVAQHRVQSVGNDVVATAKACGLQVRSLVVLAALSSVVVANGKSPAKGLLKFKAGYGREEAYNALADLRSLELLMHIFAIWPDQRVMLCTADKDLALFWSGIGASNFVRQVGNISFDIDATPLFPDVTQEQWKTWLTE